MGIYVQFSDADFSKNGFDISAQLPDIPEDPDVPDTPGDEGDYVDISGNIVWRGKLANDLTTSIAVNIYNEQCLNVSNDLQGNRSVGIVDVSNYRGKTIRIKTNANYSSSRVWYNFFSTESVDNIYNKSHQETIISVGGWNNCTDRSDWINKSGGGSGNINAQIESSFVIPDSANTFVFAQVQASVSPFEGFVKIKN